MRLLHIAGGLIGIGSGAVALYALKGAMLHRKSGMIFVYAMLVMSGTGALMAAMEPNRANVVAGVLTFYLVFSALRTIRRPPGAFQWIDVGAMLIALTVGIASVRFGLEAADTPRGILDGQPAPLYFIFGSVALLSALSDVRMLTRGIEGRRRLARHLWRMCFALFVAVGSFFLGQAQVFPEPIRQSGLLPVPVVLVLLLMFYWLVRVLSSNRFSSFRGSWHAPTPQ